FMAPEEFEHGATIGERTTVFTMGRTVQLFVDCEMDVHVDMCRDLLDVAERACQTHPTDRWPRMADFYAAWRQAAASVY
ncbi:MAG: serine/threonine protein kinase, partial [Candidatus Latescibacterota bacterium]